eukprot:scaffold22_cov107-Isochrysis_galbana.AAC.3
MNALTKKTTSPPVPRMGRGGGWRGVAKKTIWPSDRDARGHSPSFRLVQAAYPPPRPVALITTGLICTRQGYTRVGKGARAPGSD